MKITLAADTDLWVTVADAPIVMGASTVLYVGVRCARVLRAPYVAGAAPGVLG